MVLNSALSELLKLGMYGYQVSVTAVYFVLCWYIDGNTCGQKLWGDKKLQINLWWPNNIKTRMYLH